MRSAVAWHSAKGTLSRCCDRTSTPTSPDFSLKIKPMAKDVDRSTYLDKNFDYTKLTKEQLRSILFENDVHNIPPITEKKSAYLDVYRREIHGRIDELSKPVKPDGSDIRYVSHFSSENIFQSPKRMSIDIKRNGSLEPESSASGTVRREFFGETPERTIDMSSRPSSRLVLNVRRDSPKRDLQSTCRDSSVHTHVQPGASPQDRGLLIAGSRVHSETTQQRPSEKEAASQRSLKGDQRQRSSKQPGKEKTDASLSTESSIVVEEVFDHAYLVSTPSRVKKSKFTVEYIEKSSRRELVLYVVMLVYVYFRFLCPYCTEGKTFCVPVPRNAQLVNGMLKCKSGFALRRGLRNRCENAFLNELRRGVSVEKLDPRVLRLRGVHMHSGIAMIEESGAAALARHAENIFAVSEVPVLVLLFLSSIANWRVRNARIRRAVEKEAVRCTKELEKVLKSRCREGRLMPVSTAKKQFGTDGRVWAKVLRRIKAHVVERSGVVDGKQTKVWEWSGEI